MRIGRDAVGAHDLEALASDYCGRCGLCARTLMHCRGLEWISQRYNLDTATGRADNEFLKRSLQGPDCVITVGRPCRCNC